MMPEQLDPVVYKLWQHMRCDWCDLAPHTPAASAHRQAHLGCAKRAVAAARAAGLIQPASKEVVSLEPLDAGNASAPLGARASLGAETGASSSQTSARAEGSSARATTVDELLLNLPEPESGADEVAIIDQGPADG